MRKPTRVLQKVLFAACTGIAAVPAADADAGAQFTLDDSETTPADGFEIDLAAQAQNHRGATEGALPSIEVDYGASDRMELHALQPLAFNRSDGEKTRIGIGDTELGFKYRFLDEESWWPGVAVFPLLELPTGSKREGLGTGSAHVFLPFWLSRDFGPGTAFGGAGYWINPGTDNRNWWQVGAGATRKISASLTLGAEAFHDTPTEAGGKATTGFNIGGSYDLDQHQHLLLSAGRALQNAAATNLYTTYLAFQLTY